MRASIIKTSLASMSLVVSRFDSGSVSLLLLLVGVLSVLVMEVVVLVSDSSLLMVCEGGELVGNVEISI